MTRRPFLLATMLLAGTAHAAPVPADQLMRPPENADRFVIVSESNTHGDEWRWVREDGAIAFRKAQSLRGWITQTDAAVTLCEDRRPCAITIRGITPAGDAAESLRSNDGRLVWDSGADRGSAEDGEGFYLSRGGPQSMLGLLAEYLVRESGEVDLLPSGKARLVEGPVVPIEDSDGDVRARLMFIEGLQATPVPIWLDEQGRHFATIDYMGLMRAGYEEHFLALQQVQEEAAAQATADIAKRFLTEEARAPVLIDNVAMFDADRGQFLEGRSVLVKDGRIAAIGLAGSLTLPEGARRIDGAGKTLTPGLWDAHKHFSNGYDLLANVATGMTGIRSPGNGLRELLGATEARAEGRIVAPEIYGTIIIDQKHPLSAQGADLVSSEEEAIAAVRKSAENGLWGVKFYTSMKPEWIAPAAAEAHRLGLNVLGHVPATMRPSEAVKAGYDEVTHLNFIIMEDLPRSVVDVSNTAARFEGPAQYAKDVDLDSPVMRDFFALLKEKGTWVDPTIMLFEGSFTYTDPQLAPAYQPYAGTLPAVFERSLTAGGYPLFGDVTRDDMRASYKKMLDLIGKLYEHDIPIVAGTDGYGLELVREIELYEQAGMSKAAALQTATINVARLVGVDDRTGSIAVGKEADLLLVDGDVSEDLGALRRVVTVISDGYVMDGDDLRRAAGFSGMPQ
ncbi:amidohydrolase family protein [Sphingomicrobium lutaoense]|uniref:Imidazolonepropionase-like amidohydrolase n=1 Tax=Sphingomicrobium lutaoense TaxID=515949 RepID=A0A839Z0Q0_9SPHN|nr:amidohydrolase family protein [Sphingomicrobium lutaoense]MBB3764128.1 imidazolonepropionase-like amidohydrolase [Sphingomicrobium lutaoense]